MTCIHKRLRSRNYKKYYFCTVRKKEIDTKECQNCKEKEYKKYKKKTYKKHRRTKATSISSATKEVVRKRDNGLCVVCLSKGIKIKGEPNAHFVGRGQDGLGVEENVVCLCQKCHSDMDNGTKLKEYRKIVENYLKSKYPNWDKTKLVYKKY